MKLLQRVQVITMVQDAITVVRDVITAVQDVTTVGTGCHYSG